MVTLAPFYDAMQVLPGSRSQGEISFLVDKNAGLTQETLLDLIRTNFIQMNSQYAVQAIDTAYEITEFGKSYLDRRHPPSSIQRREIQRRNKELLELGRMLTVENTASPYDAQTVDVRDSRDYSTARLLRDAILAAGQDRLEAALTACSEAQLLSPTYSEVWRVEAFVQERCSNYPAARIAYEKAYEHAPASPTLNYFYGCFLLEEGSDLAGSLTYLQRAANLDKEQPAIYQQISWVFYCTADYDAALAAACHAFSLKLKYDQGVFCLVVGLRSALKRIRELDEISAQDMAVEVAERAISLAESSWVDIATGEALDRMSQIASQLKDIQSMVDDDSVERQVRRISISPLGKNSTSRPKSFRSINW